MKNYVKTTLLAAVLAMLVLLTGCGGKGLGAAYEKLNKANPDMGFEYDEATDTLFVPLYEVKTDPAELFKTLNKYVKGQDIGTLRFDMQTATPDDKFLTAFSDGLGSLECSSMQCLDVSDMNAKLAGYESWTAVLTKTAALYEPDVQNMVRYSDEAKANLAGVKRIYLRGDSRNTDLDHLELFPGLEEIAIVGGLTTAEREAAGTPRVQFSFRNVSLPKDGLPENLNRVLFFPDLEAFEPDANYYQLVLMLQEFLPSVRTNEPGKGWDGSEETLVAVADIDVVAGSGNDKNVISLLETYLGNNAAGVYESCADFPVDNGEPKLNGKCLIYMAFPGDENWGRTNIFYTFMSDVFYDEVAGGVALPTGARDYQTFVYIYPVFNLVGYYDAGTEAYSTTTMMRVYDLEKGIRYKDVQIDFAEPQEKIYYSGKVPKRSHPYVNKTLIADYLKKM